MTDEIGRLDRLTFSQISSLSCSLQLLMSLQLEFIYIYIIIYTRNSCCNSVGSNRILTLQDLQWIALRT